VVPLPLPAELPQFRSCGLNVLQELRAAPGPRFELSALTRLGRILVDEEKTGLLETTPCRRSLLETSTAERKARLKVAGPIAHKGSQRKPPDEAERSVQRNKQIYI
jgi:hypothetical protein